jgi:hypothetical protein
VYVSEFESHVALILTAQCIVKSLSAHVGFFSHGFVLRDGETEF